MESLPVDMPHCRAAFISVAAIMPQAMGSGKPWQATPNARFSAKRNEWFMRTWSHALIYDINSTSMRTPRGNLALWNRTRYGSYRACAGGGMLVRTAG
jgi:hypothetical protein